MPYLYKAKGLQGSFSTSPSNMRKEKWHRSRMYDLVSGFNPIEKY